MLSAMRFLVTWLFTIIEVRMENASDSQHFCFALQNANSKCFMIFVSSTIICVHWSIISWHGSKQFHLLVAFILPKLFAYTTRRKLNDFIIWLIYVFTLHFHICFISVRVWLWLILLYWKERRPSRSVIKVECKLLDFYIANRTYVSAFD